MARSVHLRRAVLLGLAGIGSWATVTASAQDTQVPKQGTTDTARTEQLEEIVVTGTQIRGVAPVGSNVVSVNEEWIESTEEEWLFSFISICQAFQIEPDYLRNGLRRRVADMNAKQSPPLRRAA